MLSLSNHNHSIILLPVAAVGLLVNTTQFDGFCSSKKLSEWLDDVFQ